MSEYATRIRSHPIWERLRALRAQLESIEVRAEDGAGVSADLSRLRTVMDTVEGRLQAADPILLFPGPLDSMDTHIQNATSEIGSFQSNRNRTHVSNANTQLDSLLAYSAQLGLSAGPTAPEGVAAIEAVRAQAEQALNGLLKREKALAAQLAKLQEAAAATNTEVTAQKGRLDTAIAEYQTQFSAAEATRQQQATEALKNHTQRLDQALTDAQRRLQESTQDASKRLETMLQEALAKSSQQRDELSSGAEVVLESLTEMRQKAENLLHVIGSTGMAGEYQKVANFGRKATLIWQGIAGVAMIGLVVFAILTYAATQGAEKILWGGVAARAFVTITFGILAAYAARQGDRYSDTESRNRRYQLELSSLDPYLANLPEETQHKVKVDIAMKLFGNASADPTGSARQFTGTGKDPLELALNVLMELVKKRG